MNFMLFPRIFLLLQAQSHANSLAGAYPRGYGASIELIKKKKEKAFFPPIFTTDRLKNNENIIDDRPFNFIT